MVRNCPGLVTKSPAAPKGTDQLWESAGFRCAPTSVWASAARPAVGSSVPVAELRTPWPCLSTTFSGCCPSDSKRPPEPHLTPFPQAPPGPAAREFPSGAPASLISSGNFPPLALRVDKAPSAAEQASLPATKKQRGERGRWPVTIGRPSHPILGQKGATP